MVLLLPQTINTATRWRTTPCGEYSIEFHSCEADHLRLSISLLRSAKAPDADMDMGVHQFSFAIIPHLGRMQESGVILEALKFTNPVRGEQVTWYKN